MTISPSDVLDRLADLFNYATTVSCPFCKEADFDGPGLLSHMFRRCDVEPGSSAKPWASDAEIITALRKAAAKARGE